MRASEHLCLAFEGAGAFRARAVEFLAEGLARGDRVRYIGPADVEGVRAELERMPGARPGAVEVMAVAQTYGAATGPVSPEALVATYAAATAEALAAGFTGFRAAADVTVLVSTPAQLDAFARYEHRVDRWMTAAPFTAMCGYDRAELGDLAVAQLACLHPGGTAAATLFRVHAARDADLVLSGELDLTTVDLFARALERTGALTGGRAEVVVDATGLRFVDHRNLFALAGTAHHHGCTAVLRTRRSVPARLVESLATPGLRMERAE